MSVVILAQGAKAPEGAKRLYRDALVTEGTLLLLDFSNRGCLVDFDITKPVTDLAKEAAADVSVNNSTTLKWSSNKVEKPELSEGRGFKMTDLGRVDEPFDFGLDLGLDIGNYLHKNQPNFIFTVWFNRVASISTGGRVIRLATDGSDTKHVVSANVLDSGAFNPSIAGVAGGSVLSQGAAQQYTLEYREAGEPLRRFMNGRFHSETAQNAGAIEEPTAGLVVGNNNNNRTDIAINIYRIVIEDLSKSGRSVEEVVKKDWEYCTGTGEYAGLPTKRPFIDNI